MRLILGLCLAAWATAEEDGLEVVPQLEVVRNQTPFPLQVRWHGLPDMQPVRLTARVVDAEGEAGATTLTLPSGEPLLWPTMVAPAPQRPVVAPVHWQVELMVADTVRAHREGAAQLPSELGMPPQADALSQRLLGEMLAHPEAWSLADVQRIRTGLPGWQGLPDTVDGSLQPVRVTTAPAAQRVVVVLRTLPTDDGGAGARWPRLPGAWRAAARAANVTVVEVFPGGDRLWCGPGLRRTAQVRAAWPGSIVYAVDEVPAAAAAGGPVVTVRGAELEDPAAWLRPPRPAPAAGPIGPLMAWSTGPVTVVVATGEHQAARDDAAETAEAFQAAWWRWNRGKLPQITDTEALPPTGHVVCVGSPRSHRALAAWWPAQAPIMWDHRTVRVDGVAHHRAWRPSVLWSFPRPGVPGAMVLVIDGAWRWGDFPLPEGAWAVRTDPMAKALAPP